MEGADNYSFYMQTCLPDTFTNYGLDLAESFALLHIDAGVYNELVLMIYDSLYFQIWHRSISCYYDGYLSVQQCCFWSETLSVLVI
jgi:hypothetical protein